ncbi:MAG: caspase domain-containing protein [Leptolyngbyaceae cyanobacterium]
MANQWALLIGINQYSALQPLMYAQTDAVALRNFFVDELGVPVDQCVLLTDMSATVEPYARVPTRSEIETQLRTLCQERVDPGDLLWIFFSGYGLTSNGQDYWLSIDADPLKLPETAIAVTRVFDILKAARTDQIFLALDTNRSQGAIGHQSIGQQTLAIAKDFGIATVMSCQPHQYAHETMKIRHGLFTEALLEGLRYHGCVTASQLAAYLGDRVPELSQHHWRPIQNPAAVIPSDRKFMMVVPADGISRLPVTENVAADFGSAEFSTAIDSEFLTADSAATRSGTTATQAMVSTPTDSLSVVPSADHDHEIVATEPPVSGDPSETMALVPVSTQPAAKDEEESAPGGSWKWLAAAGVLGALVVVLIRVFNLVEYLPIQFARVDRADGSIPATEPSEEEQFDGSTSSTAATANPPNSEATATASANTPANPETNAAVGEPLFEAAPNPTATGESALQRAEAAIAANRYGEARAWLEIVPPELQNEDYEALLQQANSEEANAVVRNRQILSDARQLIQSTSASQLSDAIEQARQVPSEDPYYEAAQADIARWSQMILDIAEGRESSGDTQAAISAAQLVPEDQPAVHRLAQQRIAVWQQQISNQQLIQQTQNSLQPGQASSYQDAIAALRQITPDQSGYAEAQERISQWSEDILAIARARAAQGDLAGAIAAAELVPTETEAFAQAETEIQRWQSQL